MKRPGCLPSSSSTRTATSPPTYPSGGLSFLIGETSYDAILNQWFSHYLYGLDNGIENMAAVTAQSNTNTMEWNTYDDWKTDQAVTLTGASATEETASISSDYAAIGVDRSNWQDTFTASSTASSAMYTMDVTQDTTIKGSVAVNFSASTLNGEGEKALADRDGLMVSAMLVDIAPEGTTFPACNTAGSYVPKTTLAEGGALAGRRPGRLRPGEAQHRGRVLQDHLPGLDGPVQPRCRV